MRLLVAIDTSASWKTILGEIARRTWPEDSTFRVLTVVEPTHVWQNGHSARLTHVEARDFVDSAAQYLRCAGWEASGLVRHGDPKAEVLEEAEQSSPDLILLGPHGHGFTKWMTGSVARTVLRNARCSVEIIRPKSTSPCRVLLATDGSPCSVAAARAVADRPWPSHTEVDVMTVVEPVLPSRHNPYPPYFDADCMAALRATAMESAQNALTEAEKIVARAGLKTTESILVPLSTPQNLILEEADRWKSDMIVLGCHGRQGIRRLVIGSVSEAVALEADCSVEVVRAGSC